MSENSKSESIELRLHISHTPEAISKRLEQGASHSYLRDFVYGAIDGAVTTFAVVSGVAGAGLSNTVVIVLGLVNLFADGLSMAASNYLGTRAENHTFEKARQEELEHIRIHPEGEREEVRQIFARKGFSGDILEQIVDVTTKDHEKWVDTMLREEHGFPSVIPNPFRAAFATFVAFLVVGAIPLLPFGVVSTVETVSFNPFYWSAAFTAIAFFAVGMAKAKFVDQGVLKSGFESLAVGGLAAAVAFGVGLALKGYVTP